MKILVFSDSHAYLSDMRLAVERIQPDLWLHLGDYYGDAETIRQEYPQIPMIQVPGNCDAYRVSPDVPLTVVTEVEGVRLMLTHGHRYQVKFSTAALIRAAREQRVDAVLYGHTHLPECEQEGTLWVMNPGTCGYPGSTCGLIEIENGKIRNCRILPCKNMEE